MADPAPPSGPPPPKVPEGWKAIWEPKYNEWYYVNKFTKVSSWEKPTEPAVDPNAQGEHAPNGPPPAYLPSSTPTTTTNNEKHNPNNPYNSGNTSTTDADAALAAKLQAEENARAANTRPKSSEANRGAADSYYQQGGAPAYNQQSAQGYGGQQYSNQQRYDSPVSPSGGYGTPQQAAPSEAKRGFLGKLLGKSSHPPQQQQQQYYPPQQQYPPQGQYYGQGYPQQGYYGGPAYAQAPQQKKAGGMGAGGVALGAGAGLLGGALLMNAFDDHEQYEQQQAYDAGQQDGYDQGFDAGNDDMGGGDF